MSLRSPVLAIVWEMWRLTRVEAAWHLGVGLGGSLTALVWFAAVAPSAAVRDVGASFAFIAVAVPHIVGWLSIPKVNGKRPGFPFHLLYTRPVRTAVLVGVPLAYLAVLPGALYLVSALLLRAVSGYPFPLLPVATWITALNVANLAANWWTRNRLVVALGSMTVGVANFSLAGYRLTAVEIPGWDWPANRWPTIFDLPATDYGLMALIGLASVGAAVTGVARQRHGDAPGAIPWTAGVAGFPDWLVNLFRLPCPTSSAARAQVWFDLKSTGLPMLTLAAAVAMVNPLLFAASVPVASVRPVAVMCGILSVLAVLTSGGNPFGIRWKQGHGYASAFEATQPYGTARLAVLKVLVRSICVLLALIALGVSLWASLSVIAVGQGYEPLRSWQRAIESLVAALSGYQQVALAVVASLGVAAMVASRAALTALVAHYPRRQRHPGASAVGIAGWLLLLHGLVLVPLVLTGYRGVGSVALWEFLLNVLVAMTRWIDAPAIVLATLYVSWRVFEERLLTLRGTCGVVLVSAAFAAAWVTLLQAAGVQLAAVSAADAVWLLSPALLPPMASVVAPWSLGRVRHT